MYSKKVTYIFSKNLKRKKENSINSFAFLKNKAKTMLSFLKKKSVKIKPITAIVAAIPLMSNIYLPVNFSIATVYTEVGAKTVSVDVDGNNFVFKTGKDTVKEVLEEQGISFSQSDYIEPGLESSLDKNINKILIRYAIPVEIVDQGQPIFAESAYLSAEEVLADLGITIYSEDIVTVADPLREFNTGIKIYIDRAPTVFLQADGEMSEIRTRAKTVSDVMAQEGIKLGEKDRVEPDKSSRISDGININIIRVSQSENTEIHDIPFSVKYKDDPNVPKGQTKVEQEGKAGKKEISFVRVVENGKEVKKEIISQKILESPKDKIVIRGTKTHATGSYSDWINDAAKKYGVDAGKMQRMMMCESGGNSNAVSPSGRFHGLFQYLKSTWDGASRQAGWGGYSIYDPKAQIYTTAWKISVQGYRAWPTCGLR